MKKKFLAILLGALLVASMLPVGSMAAETPVNLLPNGDFEDAFISIAKDDGSGAVFDGPAAGWTGVLATPYNPGVSYQVTSDNGVTPYSGNSFLKLAREPESFTGGSSRADRYVTLTYPLANANLEDGAEYTFEYAVNFTTNANSAKVAAFITNNLEVEYNGTVYAGNTSIASTEGWVKETYTFRYSASNTYYVQLRINKSGSGAVVAYFDDVKLYKNATEPVEPVDPPVEPVDPPVEPVETQPSLLPNGGFDDAFVSYTFAEQGVSFNVPAEGWEGNYNTAYNSGLSYQKESDNGVTPYAGTAFLKLTRDMSLYNQSVDSARANRRILLTYPLANANLEDGKAYTLEFSVNYPTSDVDNKLSVFITDMKDPQFENGNVLAGNTSIPFTNGWVTQKYSFVYSSATTYYLHIRINEEVKGNVTAYFDEVRLYDYVPEETNSLFPEGTDGTFTSAGSFDVFKMADSRAEGTHYSYVTDAETGNKYIKIHKGTGVDTFNLPIAYDETQATSDYGMYKISYKLLIPEGQELNFNGSTLGLSVRVDSRGTLARGTARFDADMVGKWIDVEVYTSTKAAAADLVYFEKTSTFDYCIDDIEVEFVEGSFISDLMPKHTKSMSRKGTDNAAVWGVAYSGTRGGNFAGTDVVMPVMRYVSTESAASALAVAAVYKTEGETRTLLDIKAANLASKVRASLAAGSSDAFNVTQVGLAPADFSINLAELDLAAGNYEVEYFLWSYQGLAPIGNSVFTLTK